MPFRRSALRLDVKPRKTDPAAAAFRATAGPCKALSPPELEATIEACRRVDAQLFPGVFERSAEVLQMRRDVMLWDADESRHIVGRNRSVEQGSMNARTHGQVSLHLSPLPGTAPLAGVSAARL